MDIKVIKWLIFFTFEFWDRKIQRKNSREWTELRNIYVCVYICVCIYIHVYIFKKLDIKIRVVFKRTHVYLIYSFSFL